MKTNYYKIHYIRICYEKLSKKSFNNKIDVYLGILIINQ